MTILPEEVLQRAVQYVHANLHSKLRWEEIAAAVGREKFSFGRGFKLATGITPHQYVIRCRLMRAMSLVARGARSYGDIAREVGCASQSHLNNLFRKHLGTTPGALRRGAALGRLSHVH